MKKNRRLLMAMLMLMACSFVMNPAKAQQTTMQTSASYYLFIGTYAPADSNGILVYRFNGQTGTASFVSQVSGIENPSFLCVSADHRFVYAVSETHGASGGQVYAYAFDAGTGRLKLINSQPSGGKDPCNITLDHTGKWLFVANYSSGSFSIFPIEDDGAVGEAVQTIRHEGKGVRLPQQAAPHAHCVVVAPGNRDVFVTDLGLDKVFTYELDDATGQLSAGSPPFTSVAPGSGPRILQFSADGKFLYLIHEIGGQITVFAYSPGKLQTIQTCSDVPDHFQGRIWAADIHLSPDGKFLYASNRDDLNDIVTYSVDQATGKLTFRNRTSSGGKTPRYFSLTPNGDFLLAAHRNGDDIVVFKRDARTGLLHNTGKTIHAPQAVCLKMIPFKP